MRHNPQKSPKYQQVFDFIVKFKKEHDGNSPSIREIGDAIDVSSTNVVRYYLNGLAQMGKIKYAGKKPRMIEVVGGHWTRKIHNVFSTDNMKLEDADGLLLLASIR